VAEKQGFGSCKGLRENLREEEMPAILGKEVHCSEMMVCRRDFVC
jgi:hypothetical protein